MTRRRTDLNTGDLYHRRHLVKKLRVIRTAAGLTLADVGELLHIEHKTVSNFELNPNPNPAIGTLQRYARALNHRLRFTVRQLPGGDDTTLLERLAEADDPDRADDAETALALHRLVGARLHLGVSQMEVSKRMRLTDTAAWLIETRRHPPHLSVYQRYARALGGRLTAAFIPVVYADEVLVERAVAGRATWSELNDVERVDAYRRLLRRGHGHATMARLLNCSGTTILDFAAKHAPAGQVAA